MAVQRPLGIVPRVTGGNTLGAGPNLGYVPNNRQTQSQQPPAMAQNPFVQNNPGVNRMGYRMPVSRPMPAFNVPIPQQVPTAPGQGLGGLGGLGGQLISGLSGQTGQLTPGPAPINNQLPQGVSIGYGPAPIGPNPIQPQGINALPGIGQNPQIGFGMPAPLGQAQIDPATGQVTGFDPSLGLNQSANLLGSLPGMIFDPLVSGLNQVKQSVDATGMPGFTVGPSGMASKGTSSAGPTAV